ncbi:beta-lactamase/transpeptidase-like protein [Dendrothele bispora CBS 962.96]|uniref:Beta-lactamase/transpeptidase-like protein n=1 Tax=Dendrothele bispora (strain CBS 962.96) TaxID=1314807 RepID=A0A4S8KXI4_DENBC|nr:beta-lactamase/transpeptidase-like protein [Dendrothele bispora CBS 962.96]
MACAKSWAFLFASILFLFPQLSLTAQIPFQTPINVQSSHALITPDIDNFINDLLKDYNSPGLSVAVIRQNDSYEEGWLTEFGSYGIAKGDGSPVTPDTLFAIASNSKLFLSFSVGLLISNETLAKERGQEISWLTKAKDLIPEWGLMDKDMENIVNIQDMLSHRTGLPRHDFSGTVKEGGVSEMISTLRYLRPSAEVRQTFQYNNLMYETLSHLPHLLLNQSFESYISQHIFAPLNMTASTYSVAEAEASGNFADGFHRSMRDTIADVNGTLTPTIPYFSRPGEEKIWAGAGGVITSARDLTKWMGMLLLEGRHPVTNETVVPTEVVRYAAEGVSVSEPTAKFPELSPVVYGAGQDRFTYQGHEVVEHGGHNPGFTTQVSRFPNDNLGLIILSNDEEFGTEIHEIVRFKLAEHILGLKEIDWKSRKQEARAKRVSSDREAALPRPSNSTLPSISLELLEGREFFHPTYGTLKPCYVGPRNNTTSLSSCEKFINNPASKRILESPFLSSSPSYSSSPSLEQIPTLLIPLSSFFATHLLLRHFDGNLFNATTVWTNYDVRVREGYGGAYPEKGDVISGLDERFVVEYVPKGRKEEEEGFAFKGGFWGMQGKVAKEPSGSGKDSAEVWFEKV